jgi:hypothetical protein
MRTKIFAFSILAMLAFAACDEFSTVGMSVQPEEDRISIFDTTININSQTVRVDSVYAKTVNGCLGEYYDPQFGTLNAGFISEFYPARDFYNVENIVGGIDSVFLSLHYAYMGDSLAPMEMTLFPVVKPLEKNFYTNINPADYCDLSNPILRHGYTARNMLVSDSYLASSSWDHLLYIPMPLDFGQKFLDAYLADTTIVTDLDKFRDFFRGIYFASTFGTGSLIIINNVDLNAEIHFYYTTNETTTGSDGLDSAYTTARTAVWAVTKEVVQLNTFKNTDDSFLTEPSDTATYIKSPSGVYTEVIIPIKAISQGIGQHQFSSVSLLLNAYPINDWEYTYSFPGLGALSSTSTVADKLLLIVPDSITSFFENQKVADGVTSFTTTFTKSTYTYNYTNIANAVQYAMENSPDEDLRLWAIPVRTQYSSDSYGNYYDYTTSPYLYPSGVKLKKGGDNLKIRITASNLEIDN